LKNNEDNIYTRLWQNLCSEEKYNKLIKYKK
jgi:hypothetical protein